MITLHIKTITLHVLVFLTFFMAIPAHSCTVIIAGKNTTEDGSILFGKTEDDEGMTIDYFWRFPRRQHKAGAFLQANATGLTISQVNETYSYFLDACPPTKYSNMVVNEWGVAFGSNGCQSKEGTVSELEKSEQLKDGGIGFMLRIILAQRAKTARQAVLIAADLIDQYGYRPSGRNLNIVGPDEAWQLQMVRGKHYVARRVRDDEVAVVSNTFSIREVDMGDRENFVVSPDLIDYAEKQGWYDPETDGDFDFAEAYADEEYHTSNSNNHRQWILAKAMNKNFPVSLEQAEMGEMPVSFRPREKLSVEVIMDVLRDHYEGTRLDKSENHRYSPHHTPHTVCRYSTHKAAVIQQRSNMPVEIGTVIWRALGQPCQSVFVPWYLGTQEIPEVYKKKSYYRAGKSRSELLDDEATNASFASYHLNFPAWKHRETDVNTASCIFHALGKLVDARYQENHPLIRKRFDRMEQQALKMQPQIEQNALELYHDDPQKGLDYLTEYTSNYAIEAYEKAQSLTVLLVNSNY
ncbi:MAG: dipeptidase [Bacteroidales bacterium]